MVKAEARVASLEGAIGDVLEDPGMPRGVSDRFWRQRLRDALFGTPVEIPLNPFMKVQRDDYQECPTCEATVSIRTLAGNDCRDPWHRKEFS
jgi:hypothetical protein